MVYTKEQLAEHDIHCFIEAYNIKNEQGLPLDFKDRMFLWDIYLDESPNIAVLKAPQVGLTVLMTNKSLWMAKNRHKDIIYTLPTQSDVHDMAGGKVNRIIAQNDIYKKWVKEHDSVEQKSVGDNIIYYRGTFTTKQAMMVSSQINIHDEVDASNAEVITQYETRQQAQAGGSRWYFSHPTLVGLGVHKYYLLSDQKHWFIQCPHCKEYQYLSWNMTKSEEMSIDVEKEVFTCKHCKGELSDDDRRKGQWVKKYNDGRLFSGYWISQLMCPWISAKKICQDYREKSQEYFHNYVLGLPYAGSGNQVTAMTIENNLVSRVNEQKGRIIIGLDSGIPEAIENSLLWVTIGNSEGIFYYGGVKTWDEIEKFMNRWPDSVVVGDQGGHMIGIRKLQEKFPNRVFLVYYRRDRKSQSIIKWGENEERGMVVVDRNKAIQLVIDEFTDRRIPLYGNKADYHDYITHWLNIYRTTEEDPSTLMPRYVWLRNGPDHLVHSTVYYRVGLDRFRQKNTDFFEPKDKRMEIGTLGIEVSPTNTTSYKPKFIL